MSVPISNFGLRARNYSNDSKMIQFSWEDNQTHLFWEVLKNKRVYTAITQVSWIPSKFDVIGGKHL